MASSQADLIGYVKIVGVKLNWFFMWFKLLKLYLGSHWGDNGFIRIERGTNTCGIAQMVVQIEYKPNNAVRSSTVNLLYLVLFCFIVHLFSDWIFCRKETIQCLSIQQF
jgi:hypothetical protein